MDTNVIRCRVFLASHSLQSWTPPTLELLIIWIMVTERVFNKKERDRLYVGRPYVGMSARHTTDALIDKWRNNGPRLICVPKVSR
jgi:hypothetical protein